MAINIEKLITQIDARYAAIDSNTSVVEQFRINQARDRLNNSGVNALTYNSTGQLPSTADSAFLGTIAYVKTDNVFGDSDGAFYIATARDSGWVRVASTQDSDEVAIAAPTPGGGASGPIAYAGTNVYVYHDDLQKFDMTSSTNAAVVITGPYFPANAISSGGRSSTHGYFAGAPSTSDTIMSFPFAAEDAISDTTANLTVGKHGGQGVPIGDGLFNYFAGGKTPGGSINVIEKYPTTAAVDATDVGDLTDSRYSAQGGSSSTHGYRAGGTNPGSQATNIIDKWPFATDENATDVGDLTQQRGWGAAASSTDHGYVAGGFHWIPPSGRYNIIDKYAFASDGNASDVGDLTGTDHNNSGGSSSTHGFRLGGSAGTPTGSTDIEKFAFASDGNATDVADLTENVKSAGSTHDTA